jgi:hypothetical protein
LASLKDRRRFFKGDDGDVGSGDEENEVPDIDGRDSFTGAKLGPGRVEEGDDVDGRLIIDLDA